MKWSHLEKPWQTKAFTAQIRRWAWTPYMPGQNMPGVGSNCVGFVFGFLDGLTGLKTPIPSSPPESIRHQKALRLFEQPLFPPDGIVPGDVLLAGPEEELHLYMASTVPDQWWHCGVSGVVPCSSPQLKKPLRRLFRPEMKSLWIPAN